MEAIQHPDMLSEQAVNPDEAKRMLFEQRLNKEQESKDNSMVRLSDFLKQIPPKSMDYLYKKWGHTFQDINGAVWTTRREAKMAFTDLTQDKKFQYQLADEMTQKLIAQRRQIKQMGQDPKIKPEQKQQLIQQYKGITQQLSKYATYIRDTGRKNLVEKLSAETTPENAVQPTEPKVKTWREGTEEAKKLLQEDEAKQQTVAPPPTENAE